MASATESRETVGSSREFSRGRGGKIPGIKIEKRRFSFLFVFEMCLRFNIVWATNILMPQLVSTCVLVMSSIILLQIDNF